MIYKKLSSKKGFSLIEALLTTVVLSGLLLLIFGVLRAYTEQVLARSASNYMEQISDAIVDILESPAYFEEIYSDADAQPNDVLELTIANIIAGEIGGVSVGETSSLNANFSTTNPLKTGVEIMIRASGGDVLEVIVATDSRAPDTRVRMAAEALKLNGGFYRNLLDGVKNAYNAWSFNPNILIGTTWWDTIAELNPPSPENGSYLINYRYLTFDDVAGDYLYRTFVDGRPELNRLYSSLNMGGQNLLGVDDLDSTGDININSNAIVNGSMDVQGATILNEGNFRAFNRFQTQNAALGVGGTFVVQNTMTTGSLNLSSEISADDATFGNGLNTAGAFTSFNIEEVDTIQSDRTFVSNLNWESPSVNSTPPPRPAITLNVGGQLNTGTIVTPSFVVNGVHSIGTADLKVEQGANINGDVTAQTVVLETMRPQTFGACDQGC